jgi:phospholipase/carboxylesterase
MNDLLDYVEINPRTEPEAVIIWLHGLGADGHDFEPIVPELGMEESVPIRFIFPHAPIRPVTINGGMRMRAWFDIADIRLNRDVDFSGFFDSVRAVENLVEAELARGIDSVSLILAGFSQGGAVALHVGLRYPKRLAGIIGLSTYLPTLESTAEESAAENRNTPIFLAHGSADPIVPIRLGLRVKSVLLGLNYPLQWRQYDMEHSVCTEEIRHISQWLKERV